MPIRQLCSPIQEVVTRTALSPINVRIALCMCKIFKLNAHPKFLNEGIHVLAPSLIPWGGILVRMVSCGMVGMAGVVS